MRVEENPAGLRALYDRLDTAHRDAAKDTLRQIQARQTVLTGELRDSFETVEVETDRPHPVQGRRRLKIFILSKAIHADAVEWGANARAKASIRAGTKRRGVYETINGKRKRVGWEVGPLRSRESRKGPHMKGNHVVADNGPAFLDHMGYRLSWRNR
jgi:hypothetical protein